MSTRKSKIQNAMSHMASMVGSHSRSHKRSAKNEESDAGSSHSKVPKRNSRAVERAVNIEKVEKVEEVEKVENVEKVEEVEMIEQVEEVEKTEECDDDEFDPTLLPLPTTSTKTATQRIYKELKTIVNKQDTPSNDLGFYVKLDKLRSVYQWVVQLSNFDPNIPLAQDMARHKVKCIDLEVRFAPDYPNLPPYIRVIRPRLLRFMNGGGGHVTAGGSICMDLLTLGNSHDRGWSSEYTMEAVLIQVKLALSTLNPPARLDRNWKNEYSPAEAMSAYIRVANQHGWGIPPQWDALFRR